MNSTPYVNPLAAREPDLPRGAVSKGALVHPRQEEEDCDHLFTSLRLDRGVDGDHLYKREQRRKA